MKSEESRHLARSTKIHCGLGIDQKAHMLTWKQGIVSAVFIWSMITYLMNALLSERVGGPGILYSPKHGCTYSLQ